MTRDETLVLFDQGRDAWNAWAEERLAERAKLEEAGQVWDGSAARADFSGQTFGVESKFHGLKFPGRLIPEAPV